MNDLIELLKEAKAEAQVVSGGDVCEAEWMAAYLEIHGVTIPVVCKECAHGSHVDTPEGRVWCERLCRYMVFEGYCSYGKKK